MLNNLEHVIVIIALIWGVVELIKHFLPSSYDAWQRDVEDWSAKRITAAEKRLEEIEAKLGIGGQK